MPPTSQTLQAINRSHRGLQIEFQWHHDRFEHRILAVDEDQVQPVMASVEGTPQDDWPPSAPLQHLTIEPRKNDVRVALLIGMAGSTHWSLGVEAIGSRQELIFDMACRLGSTPERLGTAYECSAPPSLGASDHTVSLVGQCEFCCQEMAGQPAAIIGVSEHLLELAVACRRLTSETTVRWKYRIARL